MRPVFASVCAEAVKGNEKSTRIIMRAKNAHRIRRGVGGRCGDGRAFMAARPWRDPCGRLSYSSLCIIILSRCILTYLRHHPNLTYPISILIFQLAQAFFDQGVDGFFALLEGL